ncbi:hypothetical protein EVAR_101079_1 [Eumeta japonica]|uniref:Uncharacterized protein n=1 Tax=Eumeta variegata TaxID=151549 RepID=A0A4C2AII5_EUMVA|nr:hypothetical protein EVAR_101079_1 [Eumeta japonica]
MCRRSTSKEITEIDSARIILFTTRHARVNVTPRLNMSVQIFAVAGTGRRPLCPIKMAPVVLERVTPWQRPTTSERGLSKFQVASFLSFIII